MYFHNWLRVNFKNKTNYTRIITNPGKNTLSSRDLAQSLDLFQVTTGSNGKFGYESRTTKSGVEENVRISGRLLSLIGKQIAVSYDR